MGRTPLQARDEAIRGITRCLGQTASRHPYNYISSQFRYLRRVSLPRHDDSTTVTPLIFPNLYRNASAQDLMDHYPGELYAENLLIVTAEYPITAVQQKTNRYKGHQMTYKWRDVDLITLRKRIGNSCDHIARQNGFHPKAFREGFWTVATRSNGLTCGITFW